MSIPVNEVVLLQAVQDYRLCAIKETTNSTHREGRGGGLGRKGGKEGRGQHHVNINSLTFLDFCRLKFIYSPYLYTEHMLLFLAPCIVGDKG